jgi:hypothetical protein
LASTTRAIIAYRTGKRHGETTDLFHHGPQNLALLRKLALNLAKLEPSKGSMRGKLKQAGWDNHFLVQILLQFPNLQMR